VSFSIKPRVWEILACPFCGKPLTQSANGAYCKACDHEYQFLPEGPLDLGLKKTRKRNPIHCSSMSIQIRIWQPILLLNYCL